MGNYAVIMAGGKGERFWPLSRNNLPKQFLALRGKTSLIQDTYQRLRELFSPGEILVVTGLSFVHLVQEHLPELPAENIIAEPVGRNTAPCIGLAAMRLFKGDRDAVMAVLPADHFIAEARPFLSCLEKALLLARKRDDLVTIGITPTRPETGYGYIYRDKEEIPGMPGIYRAFGFVEKPDRQKAQEYLASGDYFWNSGIFIGKAAVILAKIQKHLPRLYRALEGLAPSLGTAEEKKALAEVFPSLPAVSIDYGVMEKERGFFMVRGDFTWDDLGSWTALADLSRPEGEENGNAGKSPHIALETSNCFVYGEGPLIATLGVSDLIIVQTRDAVLVCSREKAQEIRELVNTLKEKGFEEYL